MISTLASRSAFFKSSVVLTIFVMTRSNLSSLRLVYHLQLSNFGSHLMQFLVGFKLVLKGYFSVDGSIADFFLELLSIF
jgi:hypothetical protein